MQYEQYTDDIAIYSFNIPSDLMYDMCYPLRVKTLFFCFCSGYQKDKWILKRCLMNQSFSCTVVLLQNLERQRTVYSDILMFMSDIV